jgi:antibiotic biosynthesis monooxygenase (ABM) superfamily enzyme
MSNRQTEPPPSPAPPRYKLALLTWAGAYAVITTILAMLGPLMATWPLMLKTLLLSVLMVLTLTWIVIPSLTRLFRGWLGTARVASGRLRSSSGRNTKTKGSTWHQEPHLTP